MKKKRYIIAICILIIIAIPVFTGGGIYLYIGPKYKFDRSYENVEQGEGFIPKQFHLEYNVSEVTIIPFIFYIVRSKLPKTLNISKYDITYLKTHAGFTHFKINSLSIVYDNGKVAAVITEDQPESSRIFKITENWQDAIILHNAVSEKSNFKYRIEGVSFSADGSTFPFIYEEKYRYSSGIRVGTGFEKWAGV